MERGITLAPTPFAELANQERRNGSVVTAEPGTVSIRFTAPAAEDRSRLGRETDLQKHVRIPANRNGKSPCNFSEIGGLKGEGKMLTNTIPYKVDSPPRNGNGHNGNGYNPEETIVITQEVVEVRVQRRVAVIPDYDARFAEIKAALDQSARVRAAFRPQLESIPREFPGRLAAVLFDQTACALVYAHAEPLQELTGIAMPGVWPEPEPVPVRVEVIDNSPAVETLRKLRGVLNGYGNCPSQLQHKVTEATRLLNRGS